MTDQHKQLFEEARQHFEAIKAIVQKALETATTRDDVDFWEYMGAAAEEYAPYVPGK